MFPVEVSCPKCGKSLMDSGHPIEGFPSLHFVVSYMNKEGDLWLSSLYGSYRGNQNLEIPRGCEVEFVCPHCSALLSDGPPCLFCEADTVILDMAEGGSVRICSRFGCQKHSISFGDLGNIVVAGIMNRYIVNVYSSDSVLTAAETMINYEISGVPVLGEKETLQGIITEDHLLKLIYPEEFGFSEIEESKVLKTPEDWERITCGEIAQTDFVSVSPETTLTRAGIIMVQNNVPLLLVLKEGILVGVLSRGDLSRALIREKIG